MALASAVLTKDHGESRRERERETSAFDKIINTAKLGTVIPRTHGTIEEPGLCGLQC